MDAAGDGDVNQITFATTLTLPQIKAALEEARDCAWNESFDDQEWYHNLQRLIDALAREGRAVPLELPN